MTKIAGPCIEVITGEPARDGRGDDVPGRSKDRTGPEITHQAVLVANSVSQPSLLQARTVLRAMPTLRMRVPLLISEKRTRVNNPGLQPLNRRRFDEKNFRPDVSLYPTVSFCRRSFSNENNR
jgi:hypothetical protein